MYSSKNRGFELMIPKPTKEKADFNYKISFTILKKTFTLSFKVNTEQE